MNHLLLAMLYFTFIILQFLHIAHSNEIEERFDTDNEPTAYIAGGHEAPPHSVPYQVGITLIFSKRSFCGGSLISRRFVLTAAHCTQDRTASDVRVVLGEHDFRVDGDEQSYVNVSAIIQHPNYTGGPPNWDCDFSLLRLSDLVTLSNKVSVIRLPDSAHTTFEGQTLVVSGWGNSSGATSYLKVGKLQGVTKQLCKKKFPLITENHLCARDSSNYDSTCKGDSGGPLTYTNDDGLTFLVGVTSFGSKGCLPSGVSVFARVNKHLKWILENSDLSTGKGDRENLDSIFGSTTSRGKDGQSKDITCEAGELCSTQIQKELTCRAAEQCVSGQCKEESQQDFAIINYKNNIERLKYVGNIVNGARHGKGLQVFSCQSIWTLYEGDWVEDKISGNGTLKWKTGEMYSGEWLNGLRHGKGKNIYSDEDHVVSYEGDWVENQKSGIGAIVWKDKDRYEGEFREDKISGRGVYMYKSGDRYEGEFADEKKSGRGVYTWGEQSIHSGDKYQGEFIDDKMWGKGIYTHKEGDVYDGEYINDKRHGKGTYTYNRSSPYDKYDGTFENDKPNGMGELYWKNGDRYKGQFKDWKFHGKGTKVSSTGEVLEQGEWKDSQLLG